MMKKIYTLILLATSGMMTAQSIACDATTVYAIGNGTNAGQYIHRLTRTTTGLQYVNQFVTLSPSETGGLAIADFGAGNRFYTTDYTGHLREYNGTSWSTVASTPDGTSFNNMAGKGAYLYIQKNNSTFTQRSIWRYTGTGLVEVWNDSSTTISVADMAVDDSGNLYFFTGVNLSTDYLTDTLNVMAPDGTMLQQYPAMFDTIGAYGMCFLNNRICVFFTSSNEDFPGQMIELDVSDGQVQLAGQATIPTPTVGTSTNGPIYLFLHDVATCSSALSIRDTQQDGFEVALNAGLLSLSGEASGSLTIFDSTGRIAFSKPFFGAGEFLDVSSLAKGIYILRFETGDASFVRKFAK